MERLDRKRVNHCQDDQAYANGIRKYYFISAKEIVSTSVGLALASGSSVPGGVEH